MVKISRRKIEPTPEEVVRGDYFYPKTVEPFKTNAQIQNLRRMFLYKIFHSS